MILDGERLKALLAQAEQCVLLCSPFIKARVLEIVLSVVPLHVPVRIVTRWLPSDIAAGVSDLETYHVAHSRPNTDLSLLDDLHAKLYMADNRCLVGSANLTGAALGWSSNRNVELLVPAKATDSDVALLLEQLGAATPATVQVLSKVEVAAAAIRSTSVKQVIEPVEHDLALESSWLPRCAAPGKLYDVYRNPDTTIVVADTREEGLSDLRDLHVRPGLSHGEFEEMIRCTLLLMPAFHKVFERIPSGLTDASGVAFVREVRADLVEQDARKQWRIVRDWIHVFFRDRFEVAPESFVVRIRPRG